VVGQEHVVRTLSHAVERGQVHHAYLFVGSRGTGKTSMAKILAACLNCIDGPTVSPCGRCDSCISIANATSLDVIEMDAASNNSVDDIRELREKVAYAPVSGRHKVYILDEAHMLSQQAWNAFLKTLEEPPPRTIFVLATTEAQKVLPTVVDRCHRFDFGRPSAEQVVAVLERVAAREGIEIDAGATALLARHATGSFRDALGTLEQLVTFAGERRIEPADVLAVLGVADAEQLFAALDAIIARDPAAALRAAAALADSGRDAGQVLRDLETLGRELLAVQLLGEVPAELRVTPERDAGLSDRAGALARGDAVRLLELVSAAIGATSDGAQARIQLELVLVKAADPEVDPSRAALLARIERLERLEARLAGGSPPPGPAPAPSPPPEPPPAVDSGNGHQPEPGNGHQPELGNGHQPEPAPATPAASAPSPTPAADGDDLGTIVALWPAVVDMVRGQNQLVAAALEGARPVALSDGELTLAFAPDAAFSKRKAEQDDHRRAAMEALRNVTGRSLALRFELGQAQPADGGEAAGGAGLTDDELVRRFVEEFNASELADTDTDEKVDR
jgi:DNA polymerase III subunit gamma/tau